MHPHRSWFVTLALMVGMLTISACGADEGPAAGSADPALDDLRAFVTNMGYDITVSPLAEILADNTIELVEYESLANDVVACLAEHGIDASTQFAEAPGSSGYEFILRPPTDMAETVMEATMEECERSTQFTPVAYTWASLVGPTEDESAAIDLITDQCLVDAGIEGGREAALVSPEHTDTFLACFADATTEVLSQR